MQIESQIEDANTREFQIGLLKTIERKIPKVERKRTQNWVIVKDWLLAHTSKGGSTSSFAHCRWLGVDPDGYTFNLADTVK